MNEKTKRYLLLAGFLLLGIGAGYTLAQKTLSPFYLWLDRSSSLTVMSQYAAVQYGKAKTDKALVAQENYVAYLENVKAIENEWNAWKVPWMTDDLLSYEKIIVNGRIAILLSKENRIEESERYWKKAEDIARSIGWKNPSQSHIQGLIEAIQKNYSPGKTEN
jgi:hypothetical protein